MAVSKELIQGLATALHDLTVTPARAAELAREVGRINQSVLKTAERLTFDDEPAAFARVLRDRG